MMFNEDEVDKSFRERLSWGGYGGVDLYCRFATDIV